MVVVGVRRVAASDPKGRSGKIGGNHEPLDVAGERIAAQAPLGVQGTLRNARMGRAEGPAAAADELRELLPGILASKDAAEGVRSFVERRTAQFTGE